MKKSDIYEIAIKVLGLYLFMTTVVASLENFVQTYLIMMDANRSVSANEQVNLTPYLIINIANFILLSALSSFLVFRTNVVVRRISSASDFEENTKLFTDAKVIYEIAIILTGLLIILWTLPEFAYKLVNYIRTEQMKGWHPAYDTNYLLISGIKIVVGLFAIVCAKPLANYFGRNRKQTDEHNSNETNSNT